MSKRTLGLGRSKGLISNDYLIITVYIIQLAAFIVTYLIRYAWQDSLNTQYSDRLYLTYDLEKQEISQILCLNFSVNCHNKESTDTFAACTLSTSCMYNYDSYLRWLGPLQTTNLVTKSMGHLVGSVMCISVIEHFVTSNRAPAIVLGFFKITISAIKDSNTSLATKHKFPQVQNTIECRSVAKNAHYR